MYRHYVSLSYVASHPLNRRTSGDKLFAKLHDRAERTIVLHVDVYRGCYIDALLSLMINLAPQCHLHGMRPSALL